MNEPSPLDLPFDPSVGPGNFPWDLWEQKARDAGVADALAGIGRSVMREAVQHSWTAELMSECGWDDEGNQMIELALKDATSAENRWRYLLDSDGDRVPAEG